MVIVYEPGGVPVFSTPTLDPPLEAPPQLPSGNSSNNAKNESATAIRRGRALGRTKTKSAKMNASKHTIATANGT